MFTLTCALASVLLLSRSIKSKSADCQFICRYVRGLCKSGAAVGRSDPRRFARSLGLGGIDLTNITVGSLLVFVLRGRTDGVDRIAV